MIIEMIAAALGFGVASMFVKKSYAKGGLVPDLFEFPEKQPKEVQGIVEKYEEIFATEGESYELAANMKAELEALGYTMEYYLDAIPFGLRRIGVPLEQVEGFEEFAKGGTLDLDPKQAKKAFHLPVEMAVYVPSTSDVDKVITDSEMKERVVEVSKYLSSVFGGYTSQETIGGYVDSKGKLVNEDVVRVVSFGTLEDFEENQNKILKKIADWCKKWSQEAIGFEVEGDLYYIPENFERGGRLGFDGLAKKVAKRYEGKEVPKEFQEQYGKRYSKSEAMEVGKKVAAKVYRQQQAKK